ncbi:MAG TPA: prenyltransferase, partial [Syntrophales bacterium]|nr:prenyltransferase [Syntrophales bacterium]
MKEKVYSWIKIARLQFYPMTFILYSLGAVLSPKFRLPVFLIGFVILFLIELCTVLTNEYFDYYSDKLNENASPFNGGSRVLVEGKLTFSEVRNAIFLILGFIVITGYLLILVCDNASSLSIGVLIFIGIFLGLGYTAPPIKFSYRGAGEIVVAITTSPYVILCGYIFQSGIWNDPLPWALSVPPFFAILGAISLQGIPDYNADKRAMKKTLAVILGPKKAAIWSMGSMFLAAISALILSFFNITGFQIMFFVAPHALILEIAVFKLIKS